MPAAVITPTYNEGDNLPRLVLRIHDALPDATVIVVDDASPDGTGVLADELARKTGRVRVIHRSGKLGFGSAYRAGFALALQEGFDPICQIDADLSHDPADLPRLVAADADMAIGSRYVEGGGTRGWPLERKLISRLGSLYARSVLNLPFRDLTGGFKCWRARCLAQIDVGSVRSEGYIFQVETTWRAFHAGFTIKEVPITFTERVSGVSKMSAAIALEAAWRVPSLRLAHKDGR